MQIDLSRSRKNSQTFQLFWNDKKIFPFFENQLITLPISPQNLIINNLLVERKRIQKKRWPNFVRFSINLS